MYIWQDSHNHQVFKGMNEKQHRCDVQLELFLYFFTFSLTAFMMFMSHCTSWQTENNVFTSGEFSYFEYLNKASKLSELMYIFITCSVLSICKNRFSYFDVWSCFLMSMNTKVPFDHRKLKQPTCVNTYKYSETETDNLMLKMTFSLWTLFHLYI